VLRRAMRAALTPLLNTLSLAGIVTLPGLMAGQIVAGADPAEAAKYQIVVLLASTAAAGLGALVAALGGVLLLTDARHRLRLDRLTPARAPAHVLQGQPG
jgi:putative ABC transport system permease protein